MAGFGRETRLTSPVGMTSFWTKQIVLIQIQRGLLELVHPLYILQNLAMFITHIVAIGVHERRDLVAVETGHTEGELDRLAGREVDRTIHCRAVALHILAQVLGGEHVHGEYEDLRPIGGRIFGEGDLHATIEVIVHEAAHIAEATRFIHNANHGGLFTEGNYDMANIQCESVIRAPEMELVAPGRFTLAAHHAANRLCLEVHQMAELLPKPVRLIA